ncbi:hypothetical protein RB195_017855 [Necator americanus]|uniref:Tat pathway signal sequence domain protein n=1 Tax=Necator americanus TaxID=51031 RepID=A0ABR1CA18_NECAM
MAFYFALLNVSAKRDDRTNTSTSHRHKRRRHSIASVESPVLDYRLLPRPQVVRNELYRDDQPTNARNDGSKQDRVDHSRLNADPNRSASTSRSHNDFIHSQEHDSKHSSRGGSARHQKEHKTSQNKATKKADGGHGHSHPTKKNKQKNETNRVLETRERPSRLYDRTALEREFCEMQVASSSRKDHQERENARKIMNGSAEHSAAKTMDETIRPATAPRGDYRWRGKRPIVVKRRVSPQESSTTSDSRRSSNQSNRSPQRQDSLASSNSSCRTGEAAHTAQSPALSLPVATIHKLSNISMPSKLNDIPRTGTLKKVTFENDLSEYVVSSDFLGDRRVLVRRGSGSAIHRRSITEQLSPSSITTTALRPFAQGTAALAGVAYGAALWAPFSGEREEAPDRQNVTNNAIEETSKRGCVGGLLRRRSTSDRHVVLGFRNEGFRLTNDVTPQAEFARTASGATLVPFAG